MFVTGSESESESEECTESDNSKEENTKQSPEETKEVYKIPSGEPQLVIDKMADYVSKNGDQFEDIIKAKKDTRFEFLEDTHEFNKYYREKLRELKGQNKEVKKGKKKEEEKRDVKHKNKEIREVKIVKKEKKVIGKLQLVILDLQYFFVGFKQIKLFTAICFSSCEFLDQESQGRACQRNQERSAYRRERRRRNR